MIPLFFLLFAACCLFVVGGVLGLFDWFVAQGNLRTLAEYRAEVMVAEARREVSRRG